VPYVKKDQKTNRFNNRVADGVGDIPVFGRYEIVSPKAVLKPALFLKGPSIALGMRLKFPTGDINDPGKGTRLPPAFQTGSGAYDIIPTTSYFQYFGPHSLFGSAFARRLEWSTFNQRRAGCSRCHHHVYAQLQHRQNQLAKQNQIMRCPIGEPAPREPQPDEPCPNVPRMNKDKHHEKEQRDEPHEAESVPPPLCRIHCYVSASFDLSV
jgi:hypothetical protein